MLSIYSQIRIFIEYGNKDTANIQQILEPDTDTKILFGERLSSQGLDANSHYAYMKSGWLSRLSKGVYIPLWKWILELILGSIVFAILYGLGMGLLSIPQPTLKCAAMLFDAAVILAIFPLWIKLFEKQWRWDLLTRHAGKNLFYGVSIGFLFFVVLSGILYVTGCYSAQYASPHWSYILVNICFYFLVACGEEVIFRGLIFRMIDERSGLWWALGISALIFGFAHIVNPAASVWSSVAIAVEAGVMLGAAYKYTNSLWFPIGIHWAWNFTQGNVFGFAVSGGDVAESILTATLSGPNIVTGGSFGPEASIIALLLGSILSAFYLWKILKNNS